MLSHRENSQRFLEIVQFCAGIKAVQRALRCLRVQFDAQRAAGLECPLSIVKAVEKIEGKLINCVSQCPELWNSRVLAYWDL